MIGLFCMLIAVPPQIDLEQFLPPASPPVKCAPDMSNFPAYVLPFDTEQVLFYHDLTTFAAREITIRPGYVVSECELLKITNLRMEAKRLRTELAAMRVLRDKEFQLWRVLQSQYDTQLRTLLNPPWYEKHKLAIGIALGTVATGTILATSASLIR